MNLAVETQLDIADWSTPHEFWYDFVNIRSLSWIQNQHVINYVSDMLRKASLNWLPYTIVNFWIGRKFVLKQLVKYHPNRPNIGVKIVIWFKSFWCIKYRSPNYWKNTGFWSTYHSGKSQITKFDAIFNFKNILGLNITMHNFHLVQLLDCKQKLVKYNFYLLSFKLLFLQ